MEQHEIEACVLQAKRGNQEALKKLFLQYKPYIFKSAYQFNIRNYDANDLAQIGYVALLKAIKNYKVGSNTFCGYASKSIKNSLLYTSRQNAKYDHELSLNYPVFDGQDSEADYVNCIMSDDNLEEKVLNSQELEELKSVISKLPAEDIDLINMVYYHSDSLQRYAKNNDISYFQALRKRDRILKFLNKKMKIN